MKYLYTLITFLLITPSLLVAQAEYSPNFSEGFNGATVSGSTYTFPTSADAWAGFSNTNSSMYPLSFSNPGSITFTASTAAADESTTIRFRFEANPYPNVEPFYNTAEKTITGSTPASYTIPIPSQGANTFNSFLLYVVDRDEAVTITDIVVTADAQTTPKTDVTFTVNTANITVGANGMYLGGGVFSTANAHAMTDSGNGIWTVTVPITQGTTGHYIFLNSPNDANDWGAKENLAGQACGDAGNYNDRILDAVGTDPYTLQHCFGSCETDGTCSTPVDPLLEWTATFTGNDFTAKDGLTYAEADGLGTITNINGASPGENNSPWAHIWATPEGGFDFSTSDRGVTIQVKGPRSVPVKVKFEGNDVELDQTYTDVGNWQTLTYDFSSATTETRSMAIIFFEINTAASADLADDLFYIQQFTFGEAPQDPAITSVDMDFEDAADASNWTPSDVGMSVSHVTTGGNTGGALQFGFSEGGDRRLSYTYSNFDYTGATTARITFDMLQSSTTLDGTAIHFRHSTTGTEDADATYYGAIQALGINASTWTSFEYDETVTGNSDLIHLSFQIAQGAFPEAEGEFLLDNVAVTLLDANGDTLSVYEIETPQFITYPNPLQNTLNIKGTTDVENVSIYDLMGRNVLNATPNNSEFSLDVSQLNKGVYMVQLKAGDKETTLKIVK